MGWTVRLWDSHSQFGAPLPTQARPILYLMGKFVGTRRLVRGSRELDFKAVCRDTTDLHSGEARRFRECPPARAVSYPEEPRVGAESTNE